VTDQLTHDALAAVDYDEDQVLLLFGQSEAGLAPAREAAGRAGCRVAGETGIGQALERLNQQVTAHAALVVADEPSEALDGLLARLDAEARTGRLRSIIVAPESMIDAVTVCGFHPGVDHLVEPSPHELQAAIAVATAPAPSVLHDVNRGNGIGLLQQLSEEAARIASVLASLSEEEGVIRREPSPGNGGDTPAIEADFVRSVIRARRMRDQFFGSEMFADPAWDMLLDLMAARVEGSRVAVSSLCIAAAVPATTALRWIKALSDRGLFVRSADPQDGRRVYIELSDEAARAMSRYLAAVQRMSVAAI
jgi:hypothetical protein